MRWRKFAGIWMAAAFWLMSAPAWSQEVAGSIETTSGSVSVEHSGKTWPAEAGTELRPGDRIVTGPRSYAGIKLRDETQLTMGPNGRMRISRFQFDPGTNVGSMLLTVIKGALRVTTGLIGRHAPEAVQIRTMVGTVGIRGTQFIVEAGEND